MRSLKTLLVMAFLLPALSAAADAESRFIRLERNQSGEPVALQTAITKYVPASGDKSVEVDMVSVVHIGDRGYYQRLNELFVQYDAVLYELVAPEGTKPPEGGGSGSNNPLALLQQGMKLALRLEHQMEVVSYHKANFIHADLSLEGMRKAIKDRGEDEMTVFFRAIQEMMGKASADAKKPGAQTPDFTQLLDLLRDPSKLKKLAAGQLAEAGGDAGFGKTINQLLIVDRNKACLEVLRQQLKAGKKRIAIFYGAAHMPDFEKRLSEDFGLKRASHEWINAWNL